MFRIDHPTAVGVLPVPSAPGAPGYFKTQAPGAPDPSTIVTDEWANGIQEELMSVLAAAGIAADKTQFNQLLLSIQSIIGSSAVVGAGSIFGLTLANNGANPTTRIDFAAGFCRDSLNGVGIVLAAGLTKRLDAAWVAGGGNGGRDTGALANGQTWHCYVIYNPATLAVDGLFSQSATAPTLPAGFTKFRRLGAVVLDAAATTIRKFRQTGDYFEYETRSTDYAAQANGGGVATLRSVAVPVGIKVRGRFYFQSTGTANTTAYLSGIYDPDFGVPPAFGGAAQRAAIRRVAAYQQASAIDLSYGTVDNYPCFTDTTGKVYTFSSDNAGDVIALGVVGWEDTRGKFF